jgi:SulP family sulfate permease
MLAMKFKKPENFAGDFWGGLAAMLVALPSAVAFGVTIFAAVGSAYGAYGALAGILGATALGLVAPLFGGTNRLITAPCAPAAAVMSAFAIEEVSNGVPAESILILLMLVGLFAGMIQIIFGISKLGNLIKYMPYPVVSGYLSGVGLYIIVAQTPKLLGSPKDMHFWDSLASIHLWQWQSITVGLVTMCVMLVAQKITKTIPAAILGLIAGIIAYFAIGFFDSKLLQIANNPFIIGAVNSGDGSFFEATKYRWEHIAKVNLIDIAGIFIPALTLAALLSIDTLKTCVVLDALTHSRHDSNRELFGQGIGNIASSLIGGMPGAGQMGATLVNLSSGGCSKLSSWLEGFFSLIAFLLLSQIIAWVPVGALAGILIIVGFRMIDKHSFVFLKSNATILDFVVIAAVIFVALNFSLIMASGTGIILAILLFIREQIGAKIIHRRTLLARTSSKQVRTSEDIRILSAIGDQAVLFELQGGLFFGTANQLYIAFEADLKKRKYFIIDMWRVRSIDITAAHTIEIIRDTISENGGVVIFSRLPRHLSTGLDMHKYFHDLGLVKPSKEVRVFDDIDDAIEWVEDVLLKTIEREDTKEQKLTLKDFELFKGRKDETLEALEEFIEKRAYRGGEVIFKAKDTSDELFLIRRGAVRILLPLPDGSFHHISTLGQGNFFGELSFLDGAEKSADAVTDRETDLYIISRKKFDEFAEEHKRASIQLLEGIASTLATRLRQTNAEILALD